MEQLLVILIIVLVIVSFQLLQVQRQLTPDINKVALRQRRHRLLTYCRRKFIRSRHLGQ